MRILYVRDSITVHDRRFIAAIGAQGHIAQVVRLARGQNGTTSEHGFPVRNLPASELASYAVSEGADVAHAGPLHTIAQQVAANLPAELPLLAVSWGSDVLHDCVTDPILRACALEAVDRASAILVDCDAVLQMLRTWRPRLATPVISFPWGVDPDNYSRGSPLDWRERLGWREHCVLLSTRSWEPIYGVETLVRAFALLMKSSDNVRLVLAGDGSLRERILAEIRLHDLDAFVHTPGRLSEGDLASWYADADLYVSSSLCDGSSVSLLEAMASRKPVVVHGEHGNLEWVEENVNGWLADCAVAESLAQGIRNALLNRARWRAIGEMNRDIVLRRADWRVNSRKLSTAYDAAVAWRPDA